MGLFDFMRRPTNTVNAVPPKSDKEIAVAADKNDVNLTFADRQITFTGTLAGYNYRDMLKNKQKNIQKFFELADYYCDADPIIRGALKEVYIPFAMVDKPYLIGASDRVKKKYEQYYERIDLYEKMESAFTEFFKYGNCYIYLMEDGRITTLPVHYCRIANVQVNGEPVVEFDCMTARNSMVQYSGMTERQWLEDDRIDVRLRGYPKEVADGIKKGVQWVQLNPDNTFVFQDTKEDWMRYAIPFISGCLLALEKKERISNYEDSLIDLAARSFVHVTYGDDNEEVLPTTSTLSKIGAMFKSAMTGGALAVTNHHAKAVVVQPKTDDVFANEKYSGVNQDILAAVGISGIIINGSTSDGSSFASAQVSTQTVAIRVRRAKNKFCAIMDKINQRVNIAGSGKMTHSAQRNVPKFRFPPTDVNGMKQVQQAAKYLWQKGNLSTQTLMDAYGFDMLQQVEKKSAEQANGIHDVLAPSDKDDCKTNPTSTVSKGKRGRPTMDDSQRHSDPQKSATGRLPKASDPQGSNVQDDTNAVE